MEKLKHRTSHTKNKRQDLKTTFALFNFHKSHQL